MDRRSDSDMENAKGTLERVVYLETLGRFDPETAELVLAELQTLTDPRSPRELARVQLAILKLARGDLDRFITAVSQAKTDWRDTLVAAGLEHANWPDVLRAEGFRVPS